jgi:hypothetical protein
MLDFWVIIVHAGLRKMHSLTRQFVASICLTVLLCTAAIAGEKGAPTKEGLASLYQRYFLAKD